MSPQTRAKKRAAVMADRPVKWGKPTSPDLPLEILEEIISYLLLPLPIPPTTISATPGGSFNTIPQRLERDSECFKRIDTLRALSITCRSLRTLALPLAWERIELAIATSEELGLAGSVKIINLVLVREACSKSALLKLARALESFTNLHTIQIIGTCSRRNFSLEAFEGKTSRNVKTLVVSKLLLPLLKCCPAVTYVNFIHQYVSRDSMPMEVKKAIPDYILDTLAQGVEEIIPPKAFFETDTIVKRFVENFKSLVVLNLFEDFSEFKIMPANSVHHFKDLPNLQCIRIFTKEGRGRFESHGLYHSSVVRGSENAREVHWEVIKVLQGFAPRPDGEYISIILSLQGKESEIHSVISGKCPAISTDCRFYRETPKYLYGW